MTLPQRKSPRLQGYDYSQSGAYFVTICTHQKQHIFGAVSHDKMEPTAFGIIAIRCWQAIPVHYPMVDIDLFVIMPNHMHGIVIINHVGTRHAASGSEQIDRASSNSERTGHDLSLHQPPLLGNVIGSYKSAVTREIRLLQPGAIVWQGRYHDHIIRSETSLNHIREYIIYNPAK